MSLRISFAIALSLFIQTSLHGQHVNIDSLESLARSVPSDTTKVWLLNKLVQELREKDNNKALSYALEAERLAELMNYKGGLAGALEHQGWICYRKGDFGKSLDLSLRSLKLYEQLESGAGVARALISIGAIHFEQKQFDAAIANFKKASVTGLILNDQRIVSRCANNIAYAFAITNKLDSAEFYAEKALTIGKDLNDYYTTAYAYRTKGDIDFLRGDYTNALKNFNASLKLADADNNTFIRVATLHRLGKLFKTKGDNSTAIKYLEANTLIAAKYGYKEELEKTYKLLADIYGEQHDIGKAYRYQSQYISLHDSLYYQRQDQQIALMEMKFSTEMKEAQIDLLTKDAELKTREIERQQLWLYFTIGTLVLAVLLAVALFYINRAGHKAKRQVEEKNNAIQHQAEQLKKLNATKDKLFSIISHDLRSPLASLKALMELVGTPGLTQDEFVNITIVLRRNLDSVHEDLDNLLLWAQTQLKGLQAFPESFSLKDLADEKIKLFREQASLKHLVITNQIDDSCIVWADRNHISIVMRNLIANAIKFNPTGGRIRISSRQIDNYYEIAVTDSGVGMSQDDIHKLFNAQTHFTRPGTHKEKGVGIGLLLAKEFIENNSGSIWVSSEVGKGTTFMFTLRTQTSAVLA